VNKTYGVRTWQTLLCVGAASLLVACGEIGGAGQCNGADTTGMCVSIGSIFPEGTPDVDAFQTLDCDGNGIADDPEVITKHDASVSISAELFEGVTSPPAPAFVTFTSYVINYTPSPANQVIAPLLDDWVFGLDQKVNEGESITMTLEMIPIQTKAEYGNEGGSLLPAVYTATYTIMGTTQFNEEIVLQGSTSFNIGDFDNCG
jgi:hypothetical protein